MVSQFSKTLKTRGNHAHWKFYGKWKVCQFYITVIQHTLAINNQNDASGSTSAMDTVRSKCQERLTHGETTDPVNYDTSKRYQRMAHVHVTLFSK